MSADSTCECSHAKADHLRGVGCCVVTMGDEEDCGCGVFRPDDCDVPEEWMIQIATPDGRGTFRVRAAPDASPELRTALSAIAEEAYRQFESLKKKPRAKK